MSFVLRKSLPSMTGLIALLIGVGFAVVAYLDAPMWFPVAFAVVVLGIQYLVNPFIIQWLVPASIIPLTADGYDTEHPLGEIVARRCDEAGVSLVKLGVVDDGNPNAFTFGRSRRDARLWVTRGLLERLDERELDAVIAHEVGHITNRDFIVMTVAAVVPMVLYLIYVMARDGSRREGAAIAAGAYVAYLISQLTLLALSRAREYAADHHSCKVTGDGDALVSALVKIAYGMGEAGAAHKEEIHAMLQQGKEGKRDAARAQARMRRVSSMRAMGIVEPRAAEAMQAALAAGIDPDRALAAMRWDVVNPWGRVLEKLSSHPLVARRAEALERSGLPGRPKVWSVLRSVAAAPREAVAAARKSFGMEVLLSIAPWAVLVLMVAFGMFTENGMTIGVALVAAGVLFLVKQAYRFPSQFASTSEVTELLDRLDASPIRGIPVEVRGRIIGRGFPGYLLSPDLVIQDASGFVPLVYRQPVPLLATLFGLLRAERFIGQEVVARGWYRRAPGPAIELRSLRTASGMRARAWEWAARWVGSALVLVAGVLVLVAWSAWS